MASATKTLKEQFIEEIGLYSGRNYPEYYFKTKDSVKQVLHELQVRVCTQRLVKDKLLVEFDELMIAAKREPSVVVNNLLCPDLSIIKNINLESYWYGNYII